MRKIAGLTFAALAITLAGCASASQPPPPAAPPATQPAAQPPPAPALSGSCVLGFLAGYDQDGGDFYSGGGFYPDSAAGFQAATRAQTKVNFGSFAYPVSGAKVRIDDSGSGATVSGFTIEVDDSEGTMIVQHQISETSAFLAPGEHESFLVDFSTLPGKVYASHKTYLGSTCQVTGWQ